MQSVIILISVTKELPVESKLSQWSAMKRHWMNIWIEFSTTSPSGLDGPPGPYPEWIVSRLSPRPVPRAVLDMFTRDLQESNKLLCGNNFKLVEKPLMPLLVEDVGSSQAGVGERACARVGWDQQKVTYGAKQDTGMRSISPRSSSAGGVVLGFLGRTATNAMLASARGRRRTWRGGGGSQLE